MTHQRLSITNTSAPDSSLQQNDGTVIPTDIIYVVFEYLASSFPADVLYDPITRTTRELLYTQGEVAFKQCFISLSMVCRSWNALARPWISRVLAIRIRGTLRAPLDWLVSHPSLSLHVHHLRLVTGFDIGAELDGNLQSPGLDPAELRYFLTRFPKLHVAELVDILFHPDLLKKYVHPCKRPIEEVAKSDISSFPLKLDHFAFYDTGRFSIAQNTASLCLSWLEDVRSVLIAIRSDNLHLRWISALDIAPALTLVLARRDIFLNSPQSSRSPTFKTCLPKKLYVEVNAFAFTNLWNKIRLISHSINELCLDFWGYFREPAIDMMPMDALVGKFASLSAITIKVPHIEPQALLSICEMVLRHILRSLLTISTLHSFAMVVIDDYSHEALSEEWLQKSFNQLADWLAMALSDSDISPGLLSLDHIDLYCEDAYGSTIPFSMEQQGYFKDVFARVDAAELLRF